MSLQEMKHLGCSTSRSQKMEVLQKIGSRQALRTQPLPKCRRKWSLRSQKMSATILMQHLWRQNGYRQRRWLSQNLLSNPLLFRKEKRIVLQLQNNKMLRLMIRSEDRVQLPGPRQRQRWLPRPKQRQRSWSRQRLRRRPRQRLRLFMLPRHRPRLMLLPRLRQRLRLPLRRRVMLLPRLRQMLPPRPRLPLRYR